MANITDDRLIWVYTKYGLRKITEVMSNPSSKLKITKLQVGNSKTEIYKDGVIVTSYDYYIPTGEETSLKNSVASFYFHNKELDEENEVVTFSTTIPKTSNGYMINEMGIYDDSNNLIALCTCQDIPKPLMSDNYFIDIYLKIALHSKNLCTIYNQIELDSENEYVGPAELEQMWYNILYMEGNLCEQISQNSHIIGLNRAEQLYQLINNNMLTMSTTLLNNIFCTMSNIVGYNKVLNFWVFDYSRYVGTENSIIDMGYNGEFLNTTKNTAEKDILYKGICPCMDFNDMNFYSENSIADPGAKTWFFLLKNNNIAENAIIIAKSDYKNNMHEFEIFRRNTGAFEIRLYAQNGNYTSFMTDTQIIPESIYSLGISIPEDYINNNIKVVFNGSEIATTRKNTGELDSVVNSTIGYTSYLNHNDSDDIRYQTNSIIGLIAKLSGTLTTKELRGITLLLTAFGGINTCMDFK